MLGGVNSKFETDGDITPYNAATDAYNFAPSNYLQVPQERYLVYGKSRFEINDHFKPYIEGTVVNNRGQLVAGADADRQHDPGSHGPRRLAGRRRLAIPVAASQATMQALDTDGDGYATITGWGRRMGEMGPRVNLDDRNAYRVLAGIEGDLGGDWAYDSFYMFARTKNSQQQQGNIAISRFLAGTRTAFDNDGTLVCADAGARDPGCVPVNIYGTGNVSQEAVDYMKIGTINSETAERQMVSFIVTNSNLWDGWGAGPIGLAVGAEWRDEFGSNQTDEYLASGDVAGFNPSDPTEGSYDVAEFLSEITVPLLKDVMLAESLEFNGAFRLFGVFECGRWRRDLGSGTAVGSGGWPDGPRPVSSAQFAAQASPNCTWDRLSVSTAPSILARIPAAAAPGALRDTCIATGVPAAVVGTNYGTGGTSFPAVQGGNPDLFEETADTYTIGFVLQPSFLERFVLTVDYYNIKIEDVITTGVGTQNLVDACYDFGVTNLCNQIVRTTEGEFQSFVDTNVNAASWDTEGVDIDAGYSFDFGGGLPGAEGSSLLFRMYGTYVLKNDYTPIDGLAIVNECSGAFGRSCGAPDPEWRHSLRTTWSSGPLDVSLLWRYLGEVTDDDKTFLYGIEEFSAMNYLDATVSWEFNDMVRLNVGVDNLTDEEPEVGASTQQGGNVEQSNTYPTVYDVLGRSYWATMSVKF